MTEPAEIPPKHDVDASASATQLSILLAAATSAIDEEFRRSERLDAKSRNQLTVTAGFFAVVQAVVVGLINGTLGASKGQLAVVHGTVAVTKGQSASSFLVWLAIAGAVAAAALIGAVWVSYGSWKLRDDPTLSVNTIRSYIDAARQGNPAVGTKLVGAYATIADGRRKNNAHRADALEAAARACGVAIGFTGLELVLAFVAVAVR